MSQQSINETLIGIRNMALVCKRDSIATNNGLLWLNSNPLRYPASLLYCQITLIFFVSNLVHYVLKPFNQLSLVSQLIAGIILGPSILGHNTSLGEYIFPDRGFMILETVTTFGVMRLLFTVGVKMDPTIMFHPSRSAIIIGMSMCLFSMAFTIGLGIMMAIHLSTDNSVNKSLPYIASVHSLTGFPVISCLLSELRLLNTDLSQLAIPASMFYDVIGILISAVGTSLAKNQGGHLGNSVIEILSTLALLLTLAYIVKPVILRMIKNTPSGMPMGENHIMVVFCILLFAGFMSETIGQHYVLGPLFLGLIVPDGPPLCSALESKLEAFMSGIIYPVFISVTGLQTDIFEIRMESLWIVAIVMITSFLTKFLSVLFSALYCQVPFHEALVLTFALNTKGIIELILFNLWRNSEVLSREEFALCVVSMLIITALMSPIVKALYPPSRQFMAVRRSSIQHAQLDSELWILVCIHSHESVPMIMNLLEASHASRESPIAVLGLVMVDLVGRTTPAFMCHILLILLQCSSLHRGSIDQNYSVEVKDMTVRLIALLEYGHYTRDSFLELERIVHQLGQLRIPQSLESACAILKADFWRDWIEYDEVLSRRQTAPNPSKIDPEHDPSKVVTSANHIRLKADVIEIEMEIERLEMNITELQLDREIMSRRLVEKRALAGEIAAKLEQQCREEAEKRYMLTQRRTSVARFSIKESVCHHALIELHDALESLDHCDLHP